MAALCQRCDGKINAGELHHCMNGAIQAPVLTEVLDELKAIRLLLEKQHAPINATVTVPEVTKAKRRETR